jgi:hypothetical protein
VQTTFIFNYLSIPNFILGEFEGFEKPVGQFRPNVHSAIMLFHPSNSASLNKWVICDKRAYQKIEEGISKLRMKDEKALSMVLEGPCV